MPSSTTTSFALPALGEDGGTYHFEPELPEGE